MSLITISQRIGSRGDAIAARVAKELELTLYDNRRLQEEARARGVLPEDMASLDEKAPRLIDRLLNHRPDVYLNLMESVVLDVAKRGEGVIVGHLSQMLLRDFDCALHVLIHASLPARARNLAAEQKISAESAEQLVVKTDSEQRGFFRFAFHGDWNEPGLYDLIVNTGKISQEAAVRMIIELVGTEEIKSCSLGALEAMEGLARTKAIEAELLKHGFDLSMVVVKVHGKGKVQVNGLAPTRAAKDQVLDAIRKMPGVGEVSFDVAVRLDPI